MSNILIALLAAILMSVTVPASAETGAAPASYIAGTHYEVLDIPVRTTDPGRVEATEVFWYGCSHCYSFEPVLEEWRDSLAADVNFVRSPAMWHPTMELHARAFYTAQVLGVLDRLHPVIYEEINIRKNNLATKEAIAELFAAQGIDPEKFNKVFYSFGVNSAVKQAEARQRSYKIEGTPEIIVNGKYRVTGSMAGNRVTMMKIIDYLISIERNSLSTQAVTQ